MTSDLEPRLRALACAYPKDIFPPVSPIEAMQVSTIYPGLVDRCSAAMGRHFAPTFIECADALAAQAAEIERLTKERDELKGRVTEYARQASDENDRADALAARVAELERVLAWYGENARLCRIIHSGGDPGRQALSNDGGKRAEAALHPKTPAPAGEGGES